MENPRPTPAEAREALHSVAESRKTLAPYVRSPWWLYPAQGAGTAAFIIGLALSSTDTALGSGILVVAIAIFSLLPMLQRSPGRVVLDVYTHRGCRSTALVYVILFGAIVAAALVLNATVAASWIVYTAAATAFVLTVTMGPMMDARLERAIAAGLR